jgi:CheY-like chemotaxis protein
MIRSDSTLILCVDDSPEALKLHRLTLKQAGFPATASTGSYRALATARESNPALILLNLHCRDRDSREVVKQLKNDAATRNIPIILFSLDFVDELVVSLLNEGANGYISRPASNLPKLAEMIQAHLPEGIFL